MQAELTDFHGAFNDHWMPYADTCMLEHIDYDDVIRLESFQHDLQPIVEYTGMTIEDVLSPSVTVNVNRVKNARTKVHQTFVEPAKLQAFSNISSANIIRLNKQHRTDFELFGYEFDEKHFVASCKIQTESGSFCC